MEFHCTRCFIILQLAGSPWHVDLNNDNDDYTVVMRMIGNITIHPQYKRGSSNFDVAILQLNQSVTFSIAISPVCLPNAPIDDNIDQHAGRLVRLLGWGFLEIGQPNIDGELKCARIEVFTQG